MTKLSNHTYYQPLDVINMPFQLFVEHLMELITFHDIRGNFLYTSPVCVDLLGYTQAEVINAKMADLFHPADVLKVKRLRRALLSGAQKVQIAYRCKHKNGNWRYLQSSCSPMIDASGHTYFVTVTKDITYQTEIEKSNSNNHVLYQSLIESSDNIIALIDNASVFIYANEKAQRLLGKTLHQIEGKTIAELFTKDIASQYEPLLHAAIFQGKKSVFESSFSINGKKHWLNNVVLPVRNADGCIYAAMLNSTDITNIKKRELEIAHQNEQLSNIAYKVSHSLRSPLSNIMGLINLLTMAKGQPADMDFLEMMDAEAKKLDLVIHDIVQQASKHTVPK